MGPKLVNCCRPEQMDTQEFGEMTTRIQILEDGRVPATETKNWRNEGEKKRITREEFQRLLNNFEMECSTAQRRLWKLAKEKIRKETGELPNEEGDAVSVYKAMHEENFWSNWLRKMREVKRNEPQKPRRVKKKRVNIGKEKRRKKRTKRGRSKEDVRVSFRWRPLKFLVKEKIWRVAEMSPGNTSWRNLGIGLIVNLCGACCDGCACFPFVGGHRVV